MVDDYAHHPTEIAATLRAAKSGAYGRVIAVFQPHLFSRTRYLQREFGCALTLADEASSPTSFRPARSLSRASRASSSSTPICPAARRSRGLHAASRRCRSSSERRVRSGDLVLTLGAGDVFRVGEELLATLAGARGSWRRRRIAG